MGRYFSESETHELVKILIKLKPLNYSHSQKVAILQCLDLIIFADGKADDKELKWLEVIIKHLELPEDIMHVAVKLDAKNSLEELKKMTPLQKDTFKQVLIKMVVVDGKVAIQETQVLSTIFTILGIEI